VALAFKILGPVAVQRDDHYVAVRSPKQCTLVAALLLNANHIVSMEHICDVLWEHGPPRSAVANLRTYAAALRRLLHSHDEAASRLTWRGAGYQLRVEPGELDLDEFTDLAARGRTALTRGQLDDARTILVRALSLWRGPAAEGAVRSAALTPVLDSLTERHAATTEDLIDARLGLGEHREIAAELRHQLVAHPLRERRWAQLMTALYRGGDSAGALIAYATCRDTLGEQLGLEPGPELARLQKAILDRDPSLSLDLPREHRLVALAQRVPQQLPPDVGTFVGRAAELEQLLAAAPGARIDVSGACGVGKSALVGHAAQTLAEAHPDGQLYADLAGPTVNAAELAPRFLRALDVDAARCPDEAAARLRSVLADRQALLVVEGVTDPAQVQALVPASGRSTILFTSRTMLTTLDGIQHLDLGPLPVDDAVELLAALAGRLRIDAEPRAAAMLARLCDGLPLALRVAGVRLAARPRRPVSWLVDRMRTTTTPLDELAHGGLSVRRRYAGVLAELDGGDPVADATFRLLGRFEPGPVPTAAVAGRLGLPRPDAEAALDRLTELRLIDPFDAHSYLVRPLVSAFARELARADAQLTA
jgi:DNA-binding SARP family transcriptional activator